MLEMFMVMIIVSIIILSIPVAVKKINNVTDNKVSHGRFECWIEYDAKDKPFFKSYRVEKTALGEIKELNGEYNEYCTFIPPTNTNYIMISAVGGGGAGGQLSKKSNDSIDTSLVSNEYINNGQEDNYFQEWPEWLKTAFIRTCESKGNYSPECLEFKNANPITAKHSATRVKLRYANGGKAGQIKTMLFPSFAEDARIVMRPGSGGTLSDSNGKDTLVEIQYGSNNTTCFNNSQSCTNSCCNVLVAKGGVSGSAVAPNETWITPFNESNDNSNYGIDKLPYVLGEKANFMYVLDNDKKSTEFESRVFNKNLGDGGKGENDRIKNTRNSIHFSYSHGGSDIVITSYLTNEILRTLNIHEFDGYNWNNCKLSGNNFVCGSADTAYAIKNSATEGNNGGVVIVW